MDDKSFYKRLLIWLYAFLIVSVIAVMTSLDDLSLGFSGPSISKLIAAQRGCNLCTETEVFAAENRAFLSRFLRLAKKHNQQELKRLQRQMLSLSLSPLIEVSVA